MKLKHFFQSFKNASRGVVHVYKSEQNFRIQLFFALGVLLVSYLLQIARSELIIVLFLVFLVLGLELLNTILEKFLDLLKPRLNYQVMIIKDTLAAMVLLASFGAFVIGLVIFLPYMIELWYNITT